MSSTEDVTFTIGGRRMTFFFTPQSSGFPFPCLYTPQYTGEAGVHGSLAGDGCAVLINSAASFLCFPDTTSQYQPAIYTYTDLVD